MSDVNLMADSQSECSPMDPETLKALRGSIAKWEAIVDGTGSNRGTANCPLCQKFHRYLTTRVTCFGCPVYIATGQHGCQGSPYDAYEEAEMDDSLDELEMRDLACDELNFLKSLLPKDAP